MNHLRVLFFALTWLTLANVFAGEPEVRWLGTWNRGNYVQMVAPSTNRLVALYENGLSVFQTDLQTAPQLLGQLEFGVQQVKALLADAETAYVITDKQLLFVDIRQPASPTIFASWDLQLNDGYLDGTRLFLFGEQLTVVNVSDRGAPQMLSQQAGNNPWATGLVMNDYLIAISIYRDIKISRIETDGLLTPIQQETPLRASRPYRLAHRDSRLFFGLANRGINAAELSPDGQLSIVDFFSSDLVVNDLAFFEDYLVIAGFQGNFAGLEFVQINEGDTGDTTFGNAQRLAKGRLRAIEPVMPQLFFAVSDRGIEQFRPQASFTGVGTIDQAPLVQDIAFRDPWVFTAANGLLEVISFADPNDPQIIASYSGLEAEDQRLVYQEGTLHLASSKAYHRYKVSETGGLILEHTQALPENALPIEAMHVSDQGVRLVVGFDLITLRDTQIEQVEIPRTLPSGRHPYDQVLIEPPNLLVRNAAFLGILSLNDNGPPTKLAAKRFNLASVPRPYPTTLNGNLLIGGTQVFDVRDWQKLRELPPGPFEFESAILEDGLLFATGPQGLEVWDYANPEAAVQKLMLPAYAGQSLLRDGDRMVVFNQQPNLISYFDTNVDRTATFLPGIRSSLSSGNTLVLHNSGDHEARVVLTAGGIEEQVQEAVIQIPANTTQSHTLKDLFPSLNYFGLRIDGPRTLSTTYLEQQAFFPRTIPSPAMTQAQSVADLDSHLTFTIPQAEFENEIIVGSPAFERNMRLEIRFAPDDGTEPLDLSTTILQGLQFSGKLHFLFPRTQPGQGGLLTVTSPDGLPLAGMVRTAASHQDVGLANGFNATSTTPSPVRTTELGRVGRFDYYEQMRVHNGDLLLAGGSGALIAAPDDLVPLQRVPFLKTSRDAAMNDERIWVLNDEALTVYSRSNRRPIAQIPNRNAATRILHSGDLLFLWSPRQPRIQAVGVSDPDRLEVLETLTTSGEMPRAMSYHAGQLHVGLDHGLQTFTYRPGAKAELLEQQTTRKNIRELTLIDDTLVALSFNSLMRFKLTSEDAPRFEDDTVLPHPVVTLDHGQALLFDDLEKRLDWMDLGDFSIRRSVTIPELFDVADAQFSERHLWVREFPNNFIEFDISQPESPEQLRFIGETSGFEYLASDGDNIFSVEQREQELYLHKLVETQFGPTSVATSLGEGLATGLAARGDIVYVTDPQRGLLIVNFDLRSSPQIRTIEGSFVGLQRQGNLLVLLDENQRFHFYNVATPLEPQKVDQFNDLNHLTTSFLLDGDTLILGHPQFGISLLDIYNLARPTILSEVPTSANLLNGHTTDIAVHQGFLYIADNIQMTIVDIRNPSQPQIVNRLNRITRRVKILDGYLLADRFGGPEVFELSEPSNPRSVSILPGVPVFDLDLIGDRLWASDGSQVIQSRWEPVRATIPWVVSNDRFASRIQIANPEAHLVRYSLNATDLRGVSQQIQLGVLPGSRQEFTVNELFPNLSGYTLAIETSNPNIMVSYSTDSLNADDGANPTAQANPVPTSDLQDGLLMNFPGTGDIKALALNAPLNSRLLPIKLQLFASNGLIAQTEVILRDHLPAVHLLGQLFPEVDATQPLTLVATTANGTKLAGTAYLFNGGTFPATAEGIPGSALLLEKPAADQP